MSGMASRVLSSSAFLHKGIDRVALRTQRHAPQTRLPRRLSSVSPSLVSAETETETESKDVCRVLCPICMETEFNIEQKRRREFGSITCERCRRSFDSNPTFVDLTLSSGKKDVSYTLTNPIMMTAFQNPLVSFVYERGWRQSFATSGFPGPEKEFESALQFLAPVAGDAVMDLSCGSGLFTRRFLSSGAFSSVVAVDYSEGMLTQTQQFVNRMEVAPKAALHLVRADVARLPFPTGSFKAIFSGAAIHCWPNAAMALAEISRVLSPAGVFVFSTFTQLPKEIDDLLDRSGLNRLRSFIPRRTDRTFLYREESTLQDLCRLVGLEDYTAIRKRNYIMIRVNKPNNTNSNTD